MLWVDFLGIIECRRRSQVRKPILNPWTVTEPFKLLPDTELLEYICNENNKDLQHLVGK